MMNEREARVLASELIGVMDSIVAGMTKGSLIRGAKNTCFFVATNITLNLHSSFLTSSSLSCVIDYI
ncbi:hypothetical protein ACJIZ3_000822 [Penstemon smallii]|uniref:Uncharacterized protein n=1 Tax=Penstemon smallii TaxID=265156 RepID=A0ABD3U1V0_9LAMI